MERVGFEPRVKAYLIDVLYLILFTIIVTISLWVTGWYGVGLVSAEDLKEFKESLESSGMDAESMVCSCCVVEISVVVLLNPAGKFPGRGACKFEFGPEAVRGAKLVNKVSLSGVF